MKWAHSFLFLLLATQTLAAGKNPCVSILVRCFNKSKKEKVVKVSGFNKKSFTVLLGAKESTPINTLTLIKHTFERFHTYSSIAVEVGDPDDENSFKTEKLLIAKPGIVTELLITIKD